VLSALTIRETRDHVSLEHALVERAVRPPWRTVVLRTSFLHPSLSAASQAGLVNNLNDGMAWGLLPLFYAAAGLPLTEIAALAAAYPLTWGTCQLATGALSDRIGRKGLIVGGLLLQAAAIATIAATHGFWPWFGASVALGLGTAMVYPTLLAAVADVADPAWRGSALGVYRMWRDLGFAIGAILAGVVADRAGMPAAIGVVAAITAASGVIVAVRMSETHPGRRRPATPDPTMPT
jgi:MFS family permease